MHISLLSLVLAFTGHSSGHTIFQELYVDGKSAGHLKGIRVPSFDGPIQDLTSNDLICNGGPNPLNQPLPKDIIPIPAGSKITTEWHHTLDGLVPSDVADPIDKAHVGPIIVYMAKVDSALTTTLTGLKWFKIFEDGLSDGKWGVDRLYANKGKVDLIMPPCLENGDYLLRAEIIALHQGLNIGGAQLYMECAQVTVTGGGTVLPEGVAIPGIYQATDPGINFNVYNKPLTSYPIPGPKLFTCDGTTGTAGTTSNTSGSSGDMSADANAISSKKKAKFTSGQGQKGRIRSRSLRGQ